MNTASKIVLTVSIAAGLLFLVCLILTLHGVSNAPVAYGLLIGGVTSITANTATNVLTLTQHHENKHERK